MRESSCHKQIADTIKIGVSACLLGRKVRFDGGHKRSRFVTDALADHFEFVAFCPEVAIGMGTPREPIRLVGDVVSPEAVGVRNSELNVTQPLRDYGRKTAGNIARAMWFHLQEGFTQLWHGTRENLQQQGYAGALGDRVVRARDHECPSADAG